MRNWISKNSAFFAPVPRALSTAEKVDDLYRDAARVLTNKNILNKNIDYACNALKIARQAFPSYWFWQLSHMIGQIWQQFSKTY